MDKVQRSLHRGDSKLPRSSRGRSTRILERSQFRRHRAGHSGAMYGDALFSRSETRGHFSDHHRRGRFKEGLGNGASRHQPAHRRRSKIRRCRLGEPVIRDHIVAFGTLVAGHAVGAGHLDLPAPVIDHETPSPTLIWSVARIRLDLGGFFPLYHLRPSQPVCWAVRPRTLK